MARQLFKRTTTAFSSSPSDEQDHAYQLLLKAVDEHRALSGSGGRVGRAAAKAVRSRRAKLVQHRAFRKQLVRLNAPAILRPLPEDMSLSRSGAQKTKMRLSNLRRK
jgi:hypothetical protein